MSISSADAAGAVFDGAADAGAGVAGEALALPVATLAGGGALVTGAGGGALVTGAGGGADVVAAAAGAVAAGATAVGIGAVADDDGAAGADALTVGAAVAARVGGGAGGTAASGIAAGTDAEPAARFGVTADAGTGTDRVCDAGKERGGRVVSGSILRSARADTAGATR